MKQKARASKRECQTCADADKERYATKQRNRRARLIEENRCVSCAGAKETDRADKRQCKSCAEKNIESGRPAMQARRQRLTLEFRCVDCGEVKSLERTCKARCSRCNARHTKQIQRQRSTWTDEEREAHRAKQRADRAARKSRETDWSTEEDWSEEQGVPKFRLSKIRYDGTRQTMSEWPTFSQACAARKRAGGLGLIIDPIEDSTDGEEPQR